jgi:hypothetical protein
MQYRVVQHPGAGPNESWLVCVGDGVLARFTSRDPACAAARSLAILDCVSGRPAEVLLCPLQDDARVLWACPAETAA